VQAFKPILLSAPGEEPIVLLDPLKVVNDRLFVCSNSGGGKSHATRLLIEQAGQQLPVFVIDPVGEWSSVRAAIPGMALIGSLERGAEAPADPRLARDLALRLLELNCGAVLDLSDLKRDDQARFVRLFLKGLLTAPAELCNQGRPRLVVIDEAHRFAPEDKGEAESRASVIELMDSGRKRGLGGVLVTQRFAKVAKSAIGEANTLLIGRFAQDVDQRRAADIAGIQQRNRGIFGEFEEGEFMASGSAFGNKGKAIRFRTNPQTATAHPKPGMQVFTPPPAGSMKLAAKFSDLRVPADDEPDAAPASGSKPSARATDLELEVTELRQKLAQSEAALAGAETRYEAVVERARAAMAELEPVFVRRAPAARAPEPVPEAPSPRRSRTSPPAEPKPTKPRASSSTEMRKSSRIVLSALSIFPDGLTKSRIGTVTGLTPSGGSFNVTIKECRDNGWVVGEGSTPLKITDAGRDALGGDVETIPRPGPERIAFWRSKLRSASAQRIMDAFVKQYTADKRVGLSKTDIGTITGLATTGGSFNVAMKQLRDHGIVVGQAKAMRLNPDLVELR
jgi:hypothetical protein